MTYQEWIDAYVKSMDGCLLGKCVAAVDAMHQEFPELRKVRGHVETPWGRRGHWWLEASDGSIIDPTAEQFPAIWSYDEFKDGDEVRLGSCMNCGVELWGQPEEYGKCICSQECHDAYASYLNSGQL